MSFAFNVGTDMAVTWLEGTPPLHELAKNLSCIKQ